MFVSDLSNASLGVSKGDRLANDPDEAKMLNDSSSKKTGTRNEHSLSREDQNVQAYGSL